MSTTLPTTYVFRKSTGQVLYAREQDVDAAGIGDLVANTTYVYSNLVRRTLLSWSMVNDPSGTTGQIPITNAAYQSAWWPILGYMSSGRTRLQLWTYGSYCDVKLTVYARDLSTPIGSALTNSHTGATYDVQDQNYTSISSQAIAIGIEVRYNTAATGGLKAIRVLERHVLAGAL